MKANQRNRENFVRDRKGFTFIVPLTIAILIGFSLLSIGTYIVGTLGSVLVDTYPDNTDSGFYDDTYTNYSTHNETTWRNVSLACHVSDLDSARTNFYIYANGSTPQDDEKHVYFNLSVNGAIINKSDILPEGEGRNVSLATLISNSNVSNSNTSLNFEWDTNSSYNQITVTIYGHYYVASDWRSSNENKTVLLLGNVTDGFSSVVDIEIVVIIITALSMAILSIMAVGSRRALF